MNKNVKLTKIMVVTIMIALDIVLSPILELKVYANVQCHEYYCWCNSRTSICSCYGSSHWNNKNANVSIPPLALTGSILVLSVQVSCISMAAMYWSMFGEFLGTGIVGSLISVPVMVWFTDNNKTCTGLCIHLVLWVQP